ncbi:MAG: hypothetical protein HYY25_16530 [Candidatus Wallbacteria bacterium]|nr:hypothetical protein [Candidatus Wallbacteria bacterium]
MFTVYHLNAQRFAAKGQRLDEFSSMLKEVEGRRPDIFGFTEITGKDSDVRLLSALEDLYDFQWATVFDPGRSALNCVEAIVIAGSAAYRPLAAVRAAPTKSKAKASITDVLRQLRAHNYVRGIDAGYNFDISCVNEYGTELNEANFMLNTQISDFVDERWPAFVAMIPADCYNAAIAEPIEKLEILAAQTIVVGMTHNIYTNDAIRTRFCTSVESMLFFIYRRLVPLLVLALVTEVDPAAKEAEAALDIMADNPRLILLGGDFNTPPDAIHLDKFRYFGESGGIDVSQGTEAGLFIDDFKTARDHVKLGIPLFAGMKGFGTTKGKHMYDYWLSNVGGGAGNVVPRTIGVPLDRKFSDHALITFTVGDTRSFLC